MGAITKSQSRDRVASPSSSPFAGSSSATALEARTIRIEAGVYLFAAGKGLTADERAACERTIADLDARIAPRISGQDRAVEAAAEQLFGNLAAERRARNAAEQDAADAMVADGFMIALDGRCRAAVGEAVRRILRHEAPGLSDTFVPKAPQLAGLVDRIETEWTIERDRLARLLVTGEESPRPDPEPSKLRAAQIRELVARGASAADRRPSGQSRP